MLQIYKYIANTVYDLHEKILSTCKRLRSTIQKVRNNTGCRKTQSKVRIEIKKAKTLGICQAIYRLNALYHPAV